jgi:hypothetical protein
MMAWQVKKDLGVLPTSSLNSLDEAEHDTLEGTRKKGSSTFEGLFVGRGLTFAFLLSHLLVLYLRGML